MARPHDRRQRIGRSTSLHSTSNAEILNQSRRLQISRLAHAFAQGNSALADDIEQEIMLAALQGDLSRVASVSAWLATIAKNTFQLHLRRQSNRPECVEFAEGLWAIDCDDPVDISSKRELLVILNARLRELPSKYREIIVLRVVGARPPREVAAILGIPVETVRTRLHRGLELLRVSVSRQMNSDVMQPSRPLFGIGAFLLFPKSAAALLVVLGVSMLLLNNRPQAGARLGPGIDRRRVPRATHT